MNTTRDTDPMDSAGPDVGLDPREAAALLEQTQRRARRQLDVHKPLVTLLQAAALLVIYGAIWLSVRGQHPYQGPSLGVLGVVYGCVVVVAVTVSVSRRRAHSGVSGRSRRDDRIVTAPLAVAWISVYVFIGGLHYDGFSNAIVYGVVDASGPWLLVGSALAGVAAVRENWAVFGFAVAIVAVGAGSAFAGPVGVWGVLAVSGCAMLVARAVMQTARLRRA